MFLFFRNRLSIIGILKIILVPSLQFVCVHNTFFARIGTNAPQNG